jgi:dipeptidyl aminopeptidase/acylaminoacyl peptidase
MAAAILSPGAVAGQFLQGAIHAEGVPPVPGDLDEVIERYRFSDHASFQGWLAGTRRPLYLSESGGFDQAYVCRHPGEPPWQLTESDRSVAWVYSHPRREALVIAEDDEGDEKHRLTLYSLVTGQSRPFTNRRWKNEAAVWSRSGHLLAVSSNARNDRDFDLYVINPPQISTGRLLKRGNGSLLAQSWSPDDRRVAAVEWSPDVRRSRVHLIEVATGQTETLPEPPGPPIIREELRWSPDGGALYWLTDRDSDFLHLARYDLATGQETSLSGHIPWDIDRYSLSSDGTTAVLIVNEDGQSRLRVIDPRTGSERWTPRLAEGRIGAVSFRRGTKEFAFEWSCAQSPTGLYSYDLAHRQPTQWVQPHAAGPESDSLEGHAPFRYTSFDGRKIPAYIRHPPAQFKGPRPVLVNIHGGPAVQYRPGFSLLENFLLGELGIALVMPNIRGSTGYGHSYEQLDNGRQRVNAVRDLGALLDWISTQPDLDASRVAVSGSSHGGYLALAALVEYGDRLRAGIDVAGVSSLESSLKNEAPYAIDYWRKEYGDERDPEMREFLRSISPLSHAGRIHKPLLVVHGENDQRVNIREAEQIVSAVRQNGTQVWYVRFADEGHSFENREHGNYVMQCEILFLKQFLLGP